MINQFSAFPPADLEWMAWPTDMRQRALEVIATTRNEWVSQGVVAEPVADRARFVRRLFGLELDARSSSAARARGIRARSRRRASSQFAT